MKSNAIVYAKDGATAAIGAGQMSRVDSARVAALKAIDAAAAAGWPEPRTRGSAVASDAFFPFPDGLLAAIEAGATAVIQPGGSVRDRDVIAAADEAGVAMAFTGMRHFRIDRSRACASTRDREEPPHRPQVATRLKRALTVSIAAGAAAFAVPCPPAWASACNREIVAPIRMPEGQTCWIYRGAATTFVGDFEHGQRISAEMRGEGADYDPRTGRTATAWRPRDPNVEGPGGFYFGDADAPGL